MGFGDKFKELRDQAQQAVAENKDKIQGAVQTAAEVANARTGGKYADKISNVGEKLSTSVDKFADDPASEEPAATVTQETPKPAPTGAPPEFE